MISVQGDVFDNEQSASTIELAILSDQSGVLTNMQLIGWFSIFYILNWLAYSDR